MHKFKEMVDHYKSTHRLDNETAWDIISSFDNHFEYKTYEIFASGHNNIYKRIVN